MVALEKVRDENACDDGHKHIINVINVPMSSVFGKEGKPTVMSSNGLEPFPMVGFVMVNASVVTLMATAVSRPDGV